MAFTLAQFVRFSFTWNTQEAFILNTDNNSNIIKNYSSMFGLWLGNGHCNSPPYLPKTKLDILHLGLIIGSEYYCPFSWSFLTLTHMFSKTNNFFNMMEYNKLSVCNTTYMLVPEL